MYFNIVVISTPESTRTLLSFRFSCKNVVDTHSYLLHLLYARIILLPPLSLSLSLSLTHTHTHTHIYIYIYIYVWAQQICCSAGGVCVW